MPELLETWAVIVAAGSGERLGADVPKAFVGLGGRALLARSVELFEYHEAVDRIVLVVPAEWEEPATLLADQLVAGKVAAAVTGGPSRADSVALGLAEVPTDAGVVLVHDAARPLASPALVDRVLAALVEADGAVPGVPPADTIKRVSDGRVAETLDRSQLVAVQTPQAFRGEAIRSAFDRPPPELAAATDCASLLEAAGLTVAVVEGERRNIKITDREDLAYAQWLLELED
jgi:2-C-methyl-D-erythritol 4-phosphate cytidylyltransferase